MNEEQYVRQVEIRHLRVMRDYIHLYHRNKLTPFQLIDTMELYLDTRLGQLNKKIEAWDKEREEDLFLDQVIDQSIDQDTNS